MNMNLILNIATGVLVAKAVIVVMDALWAFVCDLTQGASND